MIGDRQQVSESFTAASGRGDVMGLVVLGLERRKQAILNVSGSVDVISLEILSNSLVQGKVTERRQPQTGFGRAWKKVSYLKRLIGYFPDRQSHW